MSTLSICPFCKEAGQKSELHPSSVTNATCMAGSPAYYDENGKLVPAYDPNWYTRGYWCSQGHQFSVTERQGHEPDIKLTATTQAISATPSTPQSATPGAKP